MTIDDARFLLPTDLDSMFAVSHGVTNTGLGPAAIQNVLVYQDGGEAFDAAASVSRTYPPGQLRANLRKLPFAGIDRDALAQTDDHPIGIMRDAALPQRSIVIFYCSVYGEDCGTAHLGAAPPAADVCGF